MGRVSTGGRCRLAGTCCPGSALTDSRVAMKWQGRWNPGTRPPERDRSGGRDPAGWRRHGPSVAQLRSIERFNRQRFNLSVAPGNVQPPAVARIGSAGRAIRRQRPGSRRAERPSAPDAGWPPSPPLLTFMASRELMRAEPGQRVPASRHQPPVGNGVRHTSASGLAPPPRPSPSEGEGHSSDLQATPARWRSFRDSTYIDAATAAVVPSPTAVAICLVSWARTSPTAHRPSIEVCMLRSVSR
jgi:hypothetical protein